MSHETEPAGVNWAVAYAPGLYFHHTNNARAARGANNRANIGNSSATE